jgi:GTPase SAR1 family protein
VKIVIRGDNNTGKSTLWSRLQGQAFKEQYETSDEIKVSGGAIDRAGNVT